MAGVATHTCNRFSAFQDVTMRLIAVQILMLVQLAAGAKVKKPLKNSAGVFNVCIRGAGSAVMVSQVSVKSALSQANVTLALRYLDAIKARRRRGKF
jgi:hypothetical protein